MPLKFKDENLNTSENKNENFLSLFSYLLLWNNSNKVIISRLIIIIMIVSLSFLSIAYKLLYVALLPSNDDIKIVRHKEHRGEIVDRNNIPLAINLLGYSLFANTQKIIDPIEAAEKITKVIPSLSKEKLIADFKSGKSFTWIKRDLTSKEKEEIHNLGIPGIYFEEEQKRIYTYGNIFSHLLGYVGRDNDGLAGLEKSYNNYLIDVKNQKPLKLTLDARIQSIVHEELGKAINHFRAIGGFVVVADPNNGEIISCVSMPDFNPHDPAKASDDELFNRYSLAVYEFGSIVKIINIAIGLDANKITLNDVYDISSLKVANFNIKDTHAAKGWHTVPEIFLHSSNIGMTQILNEIGKADYLKYLNDLGLLHKLSLEIPERGIPIIQNEKNWTDLTMATLSYGYSQAFTSLNFTNAIIPIVNGGIMYPLHFVKKDDPIVGVKVLKDQTSSDMKKLLRLGVSKGTGKKAEVPGYLIGGKTGTANKRVGRHYVETQRLSSFLAVVPANDPKYIVFILLDNPQGTKETFGFTYAGWNAAPMAHNILARIIALDGLPPLDENDSKIRDQLYVEYKIDPEI